MHSPAAARSTSGSGVPLYVQEDQSPGRVHLRPGFCVSKNSSALLSLIPCVWL